MSLPTILRPRHSCLTTPPLHQCQRKAERLPPPLAFSDGLYVLTGPSTPQPCCSCCSDSSLSMPCPSLASSHLCCSCHWYIELSDSLNLLGSQLPRSQSFHVYPKNRQTGDPLFDSLLNLTAANSQDPSTIMQAKSHNRTEWVGCRQLEDRCGIIILDSMRTNFRPVTAFCSKVSTMKMADVEVVDIGLRYYEPGWST